MNRIVRIIGMGILLVAAFDYAASSRRQTNAATLASQQTAQEMAAAVKIDNFSFSPATLEIKAGTTVTWTNLDDIPHTVVNDDKMFTVSLGLPSLIGPYVQQYGAVMAGSFMGTLPIIVIFLIMQRRFIEGIMAGAVKG